MPDELAYACLLHSEELMAGKGSNDLETVKTIRQQVESHLGQKAVAPDEFSSICCYGFS